MKNKKLYIFFTIFVVSMSLFLLNFLRIDNDYFWHIKAGEYMFKNGVLTHDIFSWYVNGKYWMSHEWLFEIILYISKLLFSSNHLFIYTLIFTSLLLLILFFTNKNNYMKNVPFSMFWVILSLILLPFMQARPHLISFSLLALTIYILFDNYNKKDSKIIYLLPIISLIWSNIHGGSSNLSYLLCLLFLISGLFEFKFKKIESNKISKKQITKYLIVFVLSIITICINIHGIKMLFYPYLNMMDKTMLNNITEWAPTNLNIISHYMYLFFVVFIFIVMLISDKKLKLLDLLLFGLCVFLGFKSIRFWAYTYIIMNYVVFNYVNKRSIDRGTNTILLLLSISLISMLICNLSNINKMTHKCNLSSEVISILKEEKPKRLYNMYDYGGELVYNDIDVFIDGRADLYSKYNYKDYLDISNLSSNSTKLIKKYNFDYFLVDRKYPINTYLENNDNYELLFKDKKVLLYKKIVN